MGRKKRKLIWVAAVSLLALLALCVARRRSPSAPTPGPDELILMVELDVPNALYSIAIDLSLGGDLLSGQEVRNANGKPYTAGESVWFSIRDGRDLPAGADPSDLSVRIYVGDTPEDVSDLDALAAHQGKLPAGQAFPVKARYGEIVRLRVTGDAETGYTAMPVDVDAP